MILARTGDGTLTPASWQNLASETHAYSNYGWRNAGDIDPDSAIMPVDELAAQALEVQAEDMALEDTLYALQKAFQDGHLDATTYLRQVPAQTLAPH